MTQPSAKVLCDGVSPTGQRFTAFEITAHRFILAEINTHGRLSRNYRSSRAVPVAKLIEEVRTNPAMPVYWGANQKGMQAATELSSVPDGMDLVMCTEANDTGWSGHEWRESNPLERAKWQWVQAAKAAANHAEDMMKNGLHKQIANRVLEPFMWAHGVISGTELDNFFGLRLHHMAQPEFRLLAEAVWAARRASDPVPLNPGQWALPYVGYVGASGDVASGRTLEELKIQSVARCARVAIKPFDSDAPSTLEQDLETYQKLNIPGTAAYNPAEPIHASPAQHQATPDEVASYDLSMPLELSEEQKANREMPVSMTMRMKNPQLWGNLVGWIQNRKTLPGEAVAPLPREYQA